MAFSLVGASCPSSKTPHCARAGSWNSDTSPSHLSLTSLTIDNTAFQNGKVPSVNSITKPFGNIPLIVLQNEQIDVAINSFVDESFMRNPSKKLSEEGQALVLDFRDVVEQAKYLVLTKNSGNLLQDFTWQAQSLDGGKAAVPRGPVDQEAARQHDKQALEGLRTLGTLIISNGQFRKLCKLPISASHQVILITF